MTKSDRLELQTIDDYLAGLPMQADIDRKRVHEIFELGRNICPEELTGIFISNYVESDGKKQLKNLWLFSDNYVIEALNFLMAETPRAEMTMLSSNIMYITIEAKNYDFSEMAGDGSILHIKFQTLCEFECDFNAFGQNCDFLKSIFEKYIKGNLARG